MAEPLLPSPQLPPGYAQSASRERLVEVFVAAFGADANSGWSSFAANGQAPGTLNSAGAQNNSATFKGLVLNAGTWAFDLSHQTGTNRGIYTVELSSDSGGAWSSVGTIDGYSAGGAAAVLSSITDVAVTSDGEHWLRLTMATKHASSSAYFGTVHAFRLRRTA